MKAWAFALACCVSGDGFAQTQPSPPTPTMAEATNPPLERREDAPAGCAVLFGGGSADVLFEGHAVPRTGAGSCIEVIGAVATVHANGRPVLRVGDLIRCPDGRAGIVTGGGGAIMVGGRPAATAGSRIDGCE